jgi:PhnB protein
MSTVEKGRPAGFHTVTPYLIIKGAAAAMAFYARAFDATELSRETDDTGTVRHGEMRIGDSPIMITDENPSFPEWKSPIARGGSALHLYVYVEDPDRLFRQAIEAGAKELLPMKDQEYGDRSGGVTDPYGHVWYLAKRLG